MKICVDYDLCMGHAVCEGLDPEVFRLGAGVSGRVRSSRPHPVDASPGPDSRLGVPLSAVSIAASTSTITRPSVTVTG
jgi:ferredoxin